MWRRSWSPRIVAGLAALADLVAVAAAGAAVSFSGPLDGDAVLLGGLIAAGVGIGTVVAFQAGGLYEIPSLRDPVRSGLRAAAAWSAIVAFGLLLTLVVVRRLAPDPAWWGAFLLAGCAALAVARLAAAAVLREASRRGLLEVRAVLVGGGPPAQAILRALRAGPAGTVRVLGYVDDRDDRAPDTLPGCPKLGDTDDLVEFVRRVPVDLVLFTLPVTAEERILAMLRKLWLLPVDIRLAAHQSRLRLRARCYSRVGGIPVFDLADRPVADWDAVLKAVFDRTVGAALLVLLSPVMLLVAAALRLDGSGGVLVREERYGFASEVIDVLRFRQPRLPDVLPQEAPSWRMRLSGALAVLMARTGIASLPQLFDVVVSGRLSLVGPAPHPPLAPSADANCDDVVDAYFARHRVKPGITGWAQIAGLDGTSETASVQRRIESDLYYIENWSLLLDLYILAMTPFARTAPETD